MNTNKKETTKARRGKPIHITVRFCDESEVTAEDRARMEAAQRQVDLSIKRIFDKMFLEQTTRKEAV